MRQVEKRKLLQKQIQQQQFFSTMPNFEDSMDHFPHPNLQKPHQLLFKLWRKNQLFQILWTHW
jgi:hypothetical protein